jgi:integrase
LEHEKKSERTPRTIRARGLGRVYQPTYRDRKTGERRTSPTWWTAYSFRGTKYRESSGSTNRNDAVKLLRRRLAEMGRGQLVGPDAEKTTFEDLAGMVLGDYQVNGRKSLKRAEDALTRLREFFGLCRALDITADRVNAYIRSRQEAGAKPASIRYELAILKRGFTLTLRAGKLAHRPYIPSIEVRNIRTGFFEESDFRAVCAHLPEDVRPVCEFMYLSGWRVGEVLPLQWRQVDFKAKTVRLEPGTTKNDEGRTFPFGSFPALADLLHRQRERTEALEKATARIIPWVFHRDGDPIRDFRKAWQKACEAAGVPGRWRHDLRRTAVRALERAGVPRSVAMKLTGHKTESVYRRYAIVSEADLSEGVAKLSALHDAEEGASRSTGLVLPLHERTGKARAKQGQS